MPRSRVPLSWLCGLLLLTAAACHTSSPTASPDASVDASPNECVAEGYVCLATPGCGPGYQMVEDLFCGPSPSTDYCCEPINPDAGASPDVSVDVAPPDVAAVDAPTDGMTVEASADAHEPTDAADAGKEGDAAASDAAQDGGTDAFEAGAPEAGAPEAGDASSGG